MLFLFRVTNKAEHLPSSIFRIKRILSIFGVYSTYTTYTKTTRVIPEYVSAGYMSCTSYRSQNDSDAGALL